MLLKEGTGGEGEGRLGKVTHCGEELAKKLGTRKSMGRMTSPRARDASMVATVVPGQPGGGERE